MSGEGIEHIHREEFKTQGQTPICVSRIDFYRWPVSGAFFGIYRCPRHADYFVAKAKSREWKKAKLEVYEGIAKKLIRKTIEQATNNQDQ